MTDPTDALIADAVVREGQDSASGHGRSRFSKAPDGNCSNCGTALKGRVCHSCGQDSDDFHRPVFQIIGEIFDNQFSFDGRFWRTIPPLVFRPGRITKHYLEGVRGRYIQPFRLYLFISVIFFFVLETGLGNWNEFFSPDVEELSQEASQELQSELENLAATRPELAESLAPAIEAVGSQGVSGPEGEAVQLANDLQQQEYQSRLIQNMRRQLLPEDYGDQPVEAVDDQPIAIIGEDGETYTFEVNGFGWLPLSARRQLAHQFERVIEDPSRLFNAMEERLPQLLFVLLPFYALIIAIGQIWRRGFYFYDHLIVSLHFHAFLFLLLTALTLLGPIFGIWSALIFLLWSNFYLYKIHRVIYEHGRIMSVLRTLTLDFTYLIVLSFASIGLMFVGLMSA